MEDIENISELVDSEFNEKLIENKIAGTLGEVYVMIPWSKIKVKSSYKFFMDRIRASSSQGTFKEFLDMLCKKVNVEMIRLDTSIIEFLNDNNAITMRLLRKETLYLANLALDAADLIKEDKKNNKK